jgi:4'-phosphopantetheinyl transferase
MCVPVDPDTSHADVLSADENARAARLRRPADRDRFRTAWVLTRYALAERIGTEPGALEFVRTCRTCGQSGHGKPALADDGKGRWEFSLSHSHGYVMLAVSDAGPVGVDIEKAGDQLMEVAAMVRGPGEIAGTAEEVLWLWVRKEAALKATGDGLAVPMTSFTVDPLHWPKDPSVAERLALADPGAPDGYRAAVAMLPDRPVGELRFG